MTMRWNVGGKLFKVDKEGSTVNYAYDATGNRVLKENVTTAGALTATYYVRDAQGNTIATYTRTRATPAATNAYTLDALGIYGSARHGEWKAKTYNPATATSTAIPITLSATLPFGVVPTPTALATYTRVVGQRSYEISNHLGNVLATVLDRKTTTAATGTIIAATAGTNHSGIFRTEIATATDYYAFGQPLPTKNYTATFAAAYRYGFNGKENDKSFDSKTIQDYGFRLYSPALCKFLSVDPLSPKYPELTPYQFASNTPIQAIDLDGLEAWVITKDIYKNKTVITKTFDKNVEPVSGVYEVTQWHSGNFKAAGDYIIDKRIKKNQNATFGWRKKDLIISVCC